MAHVSKLLRKKVNELVTVCPDTDIRDTIARMVERSAGTALVMEEKMLVGILSERDFIRKVYLQNRCGTGMKVREIMSSELTVVKPETSLETCMEMMTKKRIRHLPVLEGNRVVGIISIGDIVKYLVQEKECLIRDLQSYISGSGM